MSCVTRVLVRPFFAPTYSPSFGRPLSRARVLSAMEAPLEASALSSYLSIQKALTAVRREGKGNQLGWVPYRPAQLEDYPERPADWESACEKQCEKLGIDSGETKCHLEWATGLAGSIDKGQKAFCYGAVHRFPDHDVKHAQLVVHPTATAPAEKAKVEGGEKGRSLQVNLTDFDVVALLPHCSPAPFGDLLTESTKLDPNVRRALEANCEVKLDYKYQGPEEFSYYGQREERYPRPVFEHYLKTAVKVHLSHGQDIRLVPYKLNIYGEGDFFKPHTDTPVNPRLFIGTVVVCLPSAFSGGELLVSHGDTCQTFDFAAKSGEPGLYQFAAFYGDCLHEIRPVTQGRRVTLTYHVLRKEAREGRDDVSDDVDWPWKDRKVAAFPLPSGDAVPEKLTADLTAELRALSELGYPHVGFLLQHEYTMSGLSPEGLKGNDKFLYDLVSRAWPCRFLPVLVVDENREDVGDDACIEYSAFSRNVYAFTKGDFNYYTGALDAKPDHALKSAVPFMWYGPQLPGRVLHQHHSAGGHQGNHAEPSEDQTVYLQSAMIVDLSRKV